MAKLGRRTRLTQALHDEIVSAIRAGTPVKHAAQAAGIGETTFHRWCAEGRAKSKNSKDPRRKFADAVDQAHSQSIRLRVTRILKAGETNWQADAWWLERREPELFALRHSVDHSGSLDLTLEDLDVIMKSMTANSAATKPPEPEPEK
jgi:hypothetical protein